MTSTTLEQYLKSAFERDQIDHRLRAHVTPEGKVTFYIHPHGADGETRDFVVRGNALALNQTSDSDVCDAVDALLTARIPILEQISELCYAIEKCGASPELTDAVTKASALRGPISALVEQALALGIDCGGMAVSYSYDEQAKEPNLIGEASMASVGCAGYATNPVDDAVRLSHAAASVAEAIAKLDRDNSASREALADLVQSLSAQARTCLGESDLVGPIVINAIGDVQLSVAGKVTLTGSMTADQHKHVG